MKRQNILKRLLCAMLIPCCLTVSLTACSSAETDSQTGDTVEYITRSYSGDIGDIFELTGQTYGIFVMTDINYSNEKHWMEWSQTAGGGWVVWERGQWYIYTAEDVGPKTIQIKGCEKITGS